MASSGSAFEEPQPIEQEAQSGEQVEHVRTCDRDWIGKSYLCWVAVRLFWCKSVGAWPLVAYTKYSVDRESA